MIQILKGAPGKKGLIAEAIRAGIEKLLILMPVLDAPSIGFAAHGIYLAKESLGLPTGSAPIGVVGKWSKIKGLEDSAKVACRSGALALTQTVGANFIIYGSIAKAKYIFPYMRDDCAIIAYHARSLGIKPLVKNYPLHLMFA